MADENKKGGGGGLVSWYGSIEKYGDLLIWALLRIMLAGVVFIILLSLLGCALQVLPGGKEACAANMVGSVIQIGGIMLTWTASAFDTVIVRYLFTAGTYLKPDGAFGVGIATVWAILRDIVNLVLIGGLVWASISLILKTGQSVGKLIIQIIIAALLVNFSYFFAGAILDASHFSTRVIYQEAIFEGKDINFDPKSNRKTEVRPGLQISDRFMDATRLGGLVYGKLDLDKITDFGIAVVFSIVALLLFGFTAWIFLSMAGLFLQRFIVMIILLMTAPIGILAFTEIGSAKALGEGWWKALWSQAIFPPVLLIGIAASLKVLEKASAKVLENAPAEFGILSLFEEDGLISIAGQGPWAATWDLITVYVIGIGLLYASMRVATNIAKQEPLKVPTTGQFYGAYRKLYKPIAQGVPKALGMIGKIPIPFESRARNFGDLLTLGPRRRSVTFPTAAGLGSARQFARNEADWQRMHAENSITQANLRTVEGLFAKGKATTEEVDTARDAQERAADREAIALSRMPKDYNRQVAAGDKTPKITEREKKAGVTAQDKADAISEALHRSAEGALAGTQQRDAMARQQRASTAAPGTAPARTIAAGAADMSTKQAIDHLNQSNVRFALIDMAKEARTANQLIEAFRGNGKNGASQIPALPMQVLVQPHVRVQVNGKELLTIADRKDIKGEEWNTIAGGASDEARDHYEKNAPKRLKKKRPLPPRLAVNAPAQAKDQEEDGKTQNT